MQINQAIANYLLEMKKLPVTRATIEFPSFGDCLTIECTSEDRHYPFQVDVNRKNKINQRKISFQLRNNKAIILRRLCLNNGPHENPPGPAPLPILKPYEGLYINENHLHIYVEGYNDKWAVPLSMLIDLEIDAQSTLVDIMERFFVHCNVQEVTIRPHLFTV